MSKLQHFHSLRSVLLRDRECNAIRLEKVQQTEAEYALLRGYLLGIDHAIKCLEISIQRAESTVQKDLFSR